MADRSWDPFPVLRALTGRWTAPSDVWPGEPEPPPYEPPYAEIVPYGRWSWYITIHDGVFQWGPEGGGFFAFGKREWAEWKASRLLLRYVRLQEREEMLTGKTGQPISRG